MAGDLVLIVLKVKLIVIGQLERKEGRIDASLPEGVGVGQRSDLTALAKGTWFWGIAEKRELLSHSQRTLPLTSSPLGIRRLEMMMILSSLSNVTTSATQLGAQEWLMYLSSGPESGMPGN